MSTDHTGTDVGKTRRTKWVGPEAPLVSSNRSRSTLGTLLVNALVGLVILILANAVGFGVQISAVTLLICAVFGVPGAILVIALALFDVAFVATLVPVEFLTVLL